MRFYPARLSMAVVSAMLTLAAAPALAKPVESQDNSFHAALNRFASTPKAQSAQVFHAASDAASRIAEDSKGALAEAEADLAARLGEFRESLNEQKARLGRIGEDTAARLNVWKQEAIASWSETWPDTWDDTMSEMHRSATEALEWFRDWLESLSVPDEPTEIPV